MTLEWTLALTLGTTGLVILILIITIVVLSQRQRQEDLGNLNGRLVKFTYLRKLLDSNINRTVLTPTKLTVLEVVIIPSQWFSNLLPNQAWAAELADKVWFGRRFKNHCPWSAEG